MLVAILTCAASLAACAPGSVERQASVSTTTQVVRPGVYDFPVYEGTFVPETCRWTHPPEDPARSACVVVPPNIGIYAQMGYLTAITSNGWQLVSSDYDSFWFNRPIAGTDCADRFYFSGGFDAAPEVVADLHAAGRWSEVNGLFFFLMRGEPLCGDERTQAHSDERAW